MDKELLRVMIILLGMLVMIGMLLWHFFKSMRERREIEEDDAAYEGRMPDADDDEDDFFAERKPVDGDALLDDFEIRPAPRPVVRQPESAPQPEPEPELPPKRPELPRLIEFSLVARADQGFSGDQLFDAFERVGLKYGSVKVFERVDRDRMVGFAVASMIEPGTFPNTDLENFRCPGIVFYMQPGTLDRPLEVYDDFIETIDLLAEHLDGVVWDNQRQPLTAETIDHFRQILLDHS